MMIELQQSIQAMTDYWYLSSEQTYQDMGKFLQNNTSLSTDQILEKLQELYNAAARDHGADL